MVVGQVLGIKLYSKNLWDAEINNKHNHTQEHKDLRGKTLSSWREKTTGQTPNKSTIIIRNYNSSSQVLYLTWGTHQIQ